MRTKFIPPPPSFERDHNHLVFVGRLVEKKGLAYLLRAVAITKDQHPDLRLTVVGDGPMKDDLCLEAHRLGISDRVVFLGSVPHAELPTLYQRATAAVYPFVVASNGDQEGLGLVVVEAMGCGCPVIASDLPAVRDTVVPGVTGLLAPPGDVEGLSTAIRTALSDDALRRSLSAAALQRVRERFDWQVVAHRYATRIDELAPLRDASSTPD
ncbi:MAG TPA: glycosyltransferase family 4 protein [Gammaproteobacteria bacterium]